MMLLMYIDYIYFASVISK